MGLTRTLWSSKHQQYISDWIGQKGEIFYNSDVGELRLSDGVTPGGLPLPGAGTGGPGGIGYTGSRAFVGSTGATGFVGSSGFGYAGSRGTQGIQGYTGSGGGGGTGNGYTGSRGIQGFSGSSGTATPATTSTLGGVKIGSGLSINIDGTLNVSNPSIDLSAVDQDIIPKTANTYNLGTAAKPWKSLYVSTGTIYIGGTPITVDIANTDTTSLIVGERAIGWGYSGSIGDLGYVGSIGEVGYAGSIGVAGYAGSVGEIGYAGSIGAIGYAGSFGGPGYVGSIGAIGYVGSAGAGALFDIGTGTNNISNPGLLIFDPTSGFIVTNPTGSNIQVSLNASLLNASSFINWQVDGQTTLVANGQDSIRFIAGNGMSITTANAGGVNTIQFDSSSQTPIKTFNILNEFNAPLLGNSIFSPKSPDVIRTVQLTNGKRVGVDLMIGLYRNNDLLSFFTIPAGFITYTYSSLNYVININDYLTVNVVAGNGINFSLGLYNV